MSRPVCNVSINGKQYYSTKGLDIMGGASGLSSTLSSVVFIVSLLGVSVSSRGFDVMTIVLLISALCLSSGAATSALKFTNKPDDYTENCDPRPLVTK